jgi:hypothetical protein
MKKKAQARKKDRRVLGGVDRESQLYCRISGIVAKIICHSNDGLFLQQRRTSQDDSWTFQSEQPGF